MPAGLPALLWPGLGVLRPGVLCTEAVDGACIFEMEAILLHVNPTTDPNIRHSTRRPIKTRGTNLYAAQRISITIVVFVVAGYSWRGFGRLRRRWLGESNRHLASLG